MPRLLLSAVLSACVLALSAAPAAAQTVTDQRVWTGVALQGRLAKKSPWRWSADLPVRTRDGIGAIDQIIGRVAIGRDLRAHTNLTAGYLIVENLPEGGGILTEHRVYEQFSWAAGPASRALSLRTRVEQRFIEGNSGVSHRLREQARVSHAVAAGSRTSLIVYDELFFTANTTSKNARSIDQNRAFAGVGCPLGGPARLEIGYLNQYLRTSATARRHSHVLYAVIGITF